MWLKDRDRNTTYFHKVANASRRRNTIGRLLIEGRGSTVEKEIHRHNDKHFRKLNWS